MPRTLRPRTSQPNYAKLLSFDDDDGDDAEPSRKVVEEDVDSGSEFATDAARESSPDAALDANGANDVDDEEDDVPAQAVKTPKRLSPKKPTTLTSKQKGGATRNVTAIWQTKSAGATPALLRPAVRQNYVLPTPGAHHRHRLVPIYSRTEQVERLLAPPKPFEPNHVIPTNSFSVSKTITDRVSKSWGYCVGSGPIWELLEDRAWYKETVRNTDTPERESLRRPVVYGTLRSSRNVQLLDSSDAQKYVPSEPRVEDDDEDITGGQKPSVECYFGPVNEQTKRAVTTFDVIDLSEYMPESQTYVFSAGGPVWGLDWCPIHIDDRAYFNFKHYLAVAPFPYRSYSPNVGEKVSRPSYACIQIWSYGPVEERAQGNHRARKSKTKAKAKAKPVSHIEGKTVVRCEMVLCIESGAAHELKWCPLPSTQKGTQASADDPGRLGFLAGTFGDGSLSIYEVPDPSAYADHDTTVYLHMKEPTLRIELEETVCWSLDWANSEVIAVGTTNGIIAVYNVADGLRNRNNKEPFVPTHYITVHQAAIRAIAWINSPYAYADGELAWEGNPTVIASGGYDGTEAVTDIRELHGNIMNRTRGIIIPLTYAPSGGGIVTIDHEMMVKTYSLWPGMLGRGHVLLEPDGPVWSIGCSAFHPYAALGCADGACCTTNMLRSTRRGGMVPFYQYKIYQMDYSRKTGEFRMLDRFLPQETQEKPLIGRGTEEQSSGSGVWPPEVGVHRVTWNSGMGFNGATLLASGTAAGLCRIDKCEGSWFGDRVPYVGVDSMRGENGELGIDEDDDSD